jgi:hypothetical protein
MPDLEIDETIALLQELSEMLTPIKGIQEKLRERIEHTKLELPYGVTRRMQAAIFAIDDLAGEFGKCVSELRERGWWFDWEFSAAKSWHYRTQSEHDTWYLKPIPSSDGHEYRVVQLRPAVYMAERNSKPMGVQDPDLVHAQRRVEQAALWRARGAEIRGED